MGVIDDVISALETDWDGTVTDVPYIDNGHRQDELKKENYIFVYNSKTEKAWVTPTRNYADETYEITLELGSTESEGKRDNIQSEAMRILNGSVTGYDNFTPKRDMDASDREVFATVVVCQLMKYNVSYS
jgi:hypothetical protein